MVKICICCGASEQEAGIVERAHADPPDPLQEVRDAVAACVDAITQYDHPDDQGAPGTVEIRLSDGTLALVDERDALLVNKYSWHVGDKGYVRTTVKKNGRYRPVYMHRLVTGAGDDEEVDHKDRNKKDNRRGNLRIAPSWVNNLNQGMRSTNTSGYRGVVRERRSNVRPWVAYTSKDSRTVRIGCYATPEEAAEAVRAYRAQRLIDAGFEVLPWRIRWVRQTRWPRYRIYSTRWWIASLNTIIPKITIRTIGAYRTGSLCAGVARHARVRRQHSRRARIRNHSRKRVVMAEQGDVAPRTAAALDEYTAVGRALMNIWKTEDTQDRLLRYAQAVIKQLREERVLERLAAAEAVLGWAQFALVSCPPSAVMRELQHAMDAYDAIRQPRETAIVITQPSDVPCCPHGHTDVEERGWPAMWCNTCDSAYQAR